MPAAAAAAAENKLSSAAFPLLDAAATFLPGSSDAVSSDNAGTVAEAEAEEAAALAAEMNSFLPTPRVLEASAAAKFGRLANGLPALRVAFSIDA